MAAHFLSSRTNLRDLNNTSLELQQDLARSTPQQCVTLTHSVPSVQMYYALRTKLDTCSDKWLKEFLDLGGLDSLLDSLDQMSGRRGFTCFSDAILQMDCISCIRSVLNTNLGLEFFIHSDVHTKKLTMALNCNETHPKKQVFEMLSAVCVYSHIGYLRVLEGLSYVKNECDQLHRFSLVVQDLQKCDTAAHKVAILTFVNALINSTPDVTERIRLRNEFIGVNLLELMSDVRRDDPGEDLLLQLEVFHERKMADEESVSANHNIDFNSPQDLQDLIQAKVFGTSRMVNFVNIQQDLLAIETVYTQHSGRLWQVLDNLVHHLVHTTHGSRLETQNSSLDLLPEHLKLAAQAVMSYEKTVHLVADTTAQQGLGLEKGVDQQPAAGLATDQYSNSSVPVPSGPVSGLSKTVNSRQHLQDNRTILDNKNISQLCSSINSNNSTSGDSGSQNRTITMNRPGATNDNDESLPHSDSDSDKTVLMRPSVFSPTDLTFFSNKMDNSVKSPDSNSVASHHDNMDIVSPASSHDSNSCHSNQESDNNIGSHRNQNDSAPCTLSNPNNDNKNSNKPTKGSMNINVAECKNHCYDQNKIGCDLGGQNTSGKFPVKVSGLYDCTHKSNIDSVSSVGKCEQTGSLCEDFRGRKQSNTIERQSCPAPCTPMTTFKWITLADQQIAGREPCVWLPPLTDQEKITVDYRQLDTHFQVTSPGLNDAIEEVVLLDATMRLKINLFLSRMDTGAEDLVHSLETGCKPHLTLPMLQYLHNILPCAKEVEMLRGYSGVRLELGMAEQFVLMLSDTPDYSVLLEGRLLQAEVETSAREFRASLQTMVDLARHVLESGEMKQMLNWLLDVGNYLNNGQYQGNAAGIQLTSLLRLGEVRSPGSQTNLLSYLVQTTRQHHFLPFVKQCLKLEKAASVSMEDLKADISKLNGKLRCFMSKLACSSLKLQTLFQPFIEGLKGEYSGIQSLTTELRTLTDQLSNYFCEEEEQFNLQDCFKTILTFCKQVQQAQLDCFQLTGPQPSNVTMGTNNILQKRLKSKLLSLEFGQNAGASSSMMEDRNKLLEKILTQLHAGNFRPSVRSGLTTPDSKDSGQHPLEMSCIPYISPAPVTHEMLATPDADVFIDTPELMSTHHTTSTVGKMTRYSTQKIQPVVTTCTAQTVKPARNYPPSPITGVSGLNSVKVHRKLFPLADGGLGEFEEREIISEEERKQRPRHQIEMPSKRGTHRRSRSDMLDSLYIVDKWMEYEKTRDIEFGGALRAPMAEPESICNLSTLNLENQGKFITNRDVAALQQANGETRDIRRVEPGPVLRLPVMMTDNPHRKVEKKSSVGGFFSKLGRAVLRPRNVYSDGDQYIEPAAGKVTKERKKSFNYRDDKENINVEMDPNPMTDDKKNKMENNSNKVSRFFQRGGLYRSSKMKKLRKQSAAN